MSEKDIDKDLQNEPTLENTDDSQDQNQGEDVVPKKSFEGIRSELIQTRQEKQYYANQLSEMQQQYSDMQKRLRDLESNKDNQELQSVVGNDPDEPVTVAKLQQLWQKIQQTEKQKQAQGKHQERLQNLQSSVSRMRTDTQNKVKFGLDWDTLYPTIQRIYATKKSSNPAWEESLLYESNPAKILYDMVLQEPDVKERAKMFDNQKVLGNMENRKTDKSAVDASSSTPKPKKGLTSAEIANMSPQEVVKRKTEIDEFLKSLARPKK